MLVFFFRIMGHECFLTLSSRVGGDVWLLFELYRRLWFFFSTYRENHQKILILNHFYPSPNHNCFNSSLRTGMVRGKTKMATHDLKKVGHGHHLMSLSHWQPIHFQEPWHSGNPCRFRARWLITCSGPCTSRNLMFNKLKWLSL